MLIQLYPYFFMQHCSVILNHNYTTCPCTCRIVLSTWILPDDKLDSPSVKDSATPTNGVTTPTLEWLKAVLLPKVCQWSEENKGKSLSSGRGKSLVPLSRYSQLYRELKSKYGELLVKVTINSLCQWIKYSYIREIALSVISRLSFNKLLRIAELA